MKKKRSKKETRAHKALIGLIELYLKSGKPIGSETLKEHGFQELSSATLRNYFVEFEKEGYLIQSHISGGRTPTDKAFRLFAEESFGTFDLRPDIEEKINLALTGDTKNITSFLHRAATSFSEIIGYPIFLSSVRFDQDFILNVRFVPIDNERILAILISHFGQIYTETLFVEKKVSTITLKHIENYFHWKIKASKEQPMPTISEEEIRLAETFYSELMVRYITLYSNFSEEDIFRSGFSKLLNYSEFSDPLSLSTALSLFENSSQMRRLLADASSHGELTFWIGSELAPYGLATTTCSAIAIPYTIHHTIVGAVGLLGPIRMPYPLLFGALKHFSDSLSKALTKSLYKFKLSFRHPRSTLLLEGKKWGTKLLEAKAKK